MLILILLAIQIGFCALGVLAICYVIYITFFKDDHTERKTTENK